MRGHYRLHRGLLGFLLLLPLFVLTAGCGSKQGTITGKVKYKGQLLTFGTVRFFPESNKGGDFSSPIGQDGSYTVTKVPTGPAKITVMASNFNPTESAMPPMARGFAAKAMEEAEKQKQKATEGKGGGGNAGGGTFTAKGSITVDQKYADVEKTPLKFEVKSGKQEYNIDVD
jgi:hypothetical protein